MNSIVCHALGSIRHHYVPVTGANTIDAHLLPALDIRRLRQMESNT